MFIIEAKKENLEDLIKLNRELCDYHKRLDKYNYSSPETEKFFRKFFLKNYKKKNFLYLIAEDKGKVVGYSSAQIKKTEPYIKPKKVGEIFSIYVLEKYRRERVGKKLFEELIKWFKRNKIKHIEIFAHVKNKKGVKFWQKAGFSEYLKRMRLDL